MLKQVQFKGVDADGNVMCQPLLGQGLEKTAKEAEKTKLHPAIQAFVKNVVPTDKGVYVLVNAMGAGEIWGSNVNGDLFPTKALVHSPPNWDSLSPEEMKKVGSKWKYGFPTFMRAHPYKHHVNKDPSRAFGEVVIAVWNAEMHRVELIVFLDRALCKKFGAEDVIDRIERGEYPDVSMGCKVPHDVCTICEKASKTQHDYCVHAKTMMNKILPDGRKVAVRNDEPMFFDISFVLIGADKTAKVMAKLASQGERVCLGDYCSIPRPSAEVGALYSDEEDVGYEDEVPELLKESSLGSTVKNVIGIGALTAGGAVLGRKAGDWLGKKSNEFNHRHGFGLNGKTEKQRQKLLRVLGSIEGAGLGLLLADSIKTAQSCGCTEVTDSCSEGISKLASAIFPMSPEKAASHRKVGEIIKTVPAGPFTKETLPRLEKTERQIPKDVLNLMGGMKLASALSTTGMMGIVLSPKEFQRVMLVKIGEEVLADELDNQNMTFAHTNEIDQSIPVARGLSDENLQELLSITGFVQDRSIAAPVLDQRMMKLPKTILGKGPISAPVEPVLAKIGAAYNGYRRNLCKEATRIQQHIVLDPQLSSDIFGGSMAQAFAGGVEKTATASVFSPDSLAYLVGAHYPDRDFHTRSEAVVESLALTGAVTEESA